MPPRGTSMKPHPEAEHPVPGRMESFLFLLKTRVFIARRWWQERSVQLSRHPVGRGLVDALRIGKAEAPLWTQVSAEEFPLTAGKVQNLRAACRRLHGIEVPAGEVFSFWKQLGRTTRARGFTQGRELRSGCMVPNLGGGLCQLSGLIHAAGLEAGLEIVERHEHSRTLPGTPLPPERDATVFWNYVDLRLRAPFAWRMEAELTADRLVVRVLGNAGAGSIPKPPLPSHASGAPVRSAAEGDCLTCGVVSCFRHPSATRAHTPSAGHTAFVLDGRWPEFDDWCRRHARPGDRWLTPLDGRRWKKPGYAWSPPEGVTAVHATFETLRRSWKQRRLPGQGAVRQRFLLDSQKQLAETLARKIDPQARHLIVSQTLLPHLWLGGHLGGRTFDVLVNRWPLAELQRRLDLAAARHPESDTLADFRADAELVEAEREALSAAARKITPHRAIAAHFGSGAVLLDWEMPSVGSSPRKVDDHPRWFFPASALGRKGIHEMAQAMRGTGGELLVLGRAREGNGDPLAGIRHRQAGVTDLTGCNALVMPAWIEHEPRLALRALQCGVPVIASRECGLPPHVLLREIDAGDVEALREAMVACVAGRACAVA
ncbi:MAG: vanw family protein [Verrucomicrobiaceae bacterium]|nr:MAG: vanw family protein [Verrucomicrobiaceae bacterium]